MVELLPKVELSNLTYSQVCVIVIYTRLDCIVNGTQKVKTIYIDLLYYDVIHNLSVRNIVIPCQGYCHI